MRSPNQAILWEMWRVTRTEIIVRLSLCIVGGLIALASFAALADVPGHSATAGEFGAVIALIIIVMPNWLGWIFLGRLNKGRAGYPLPLLYSRPVKTAALIGLQFAYLTVVQVAIYLASALLLKAVSGYPFPLLPVATWIGISTLMMTAIYWSSRSVLVQQFVGGLLSGVWLLYAMHRITSRPDGEDWYDSPSLWPSIFQLTPTDWLMLTLIGVTSIGLTMYSVARQRRGDARTPWTPGSGWPDWIVNLLRIPCPTSSATRAQMWFDLKSRCLPVLSLGLMLAIINPLLFALANEVDRANPDWSVPLGPMVLLLAMMSFGGVLVIGGINAFGIRWRQGGTYFEATQPFGSAQLASLKVLVRTVCLLAALLAVGGSMWAYLSHFPLLTGDKLFWKMTGMAHIVFLKNAESAFGALTAYQKFSMVFAALVAIFLWVASLAVIMPLWVRYPRQGNTVASALLIGGLSVSLLGLAGRLGVVPAALVDVVFSVASWLIVAAIVLTTIYLFWNGVAERLLSGRYAFGAVTLSVVFGAAWLTVMRLAGLRLVDMAATNVASVLSLVVLPLLCALLVPWSLSRYRHF
jgi:hypothetical protein